MENNEIIYQSSNGELMHWGVKGQRWGVRRYQNPDGSLTSLGKKRRGQSSDKPSKTKEEKQAAKQAKKQAALEAARKKTAEKLEKTRSAIERARAKRILKQEKNELKKLNKKLEQEKQAEKDNGKLKEKLLKSSDAAEIYKHRDLFTTAELNERLSRIDTEKRLAAAANGNKSKKTIADHIDTGIKLGKKANEIYELKNTSLGKALMKQMGLEKETKVDLQKILDNAENLSTDKLSDAATRAKALSKINNYLKGLPVKDDD